MAHKKKPMQTKKDRKDESKGMKMAMDKKCDMKMPMKKGCK
jgi:hypothetical protein